MKLKELEYAPNQQNRKEEEKFDGIHVLEKDKNTVHDSPSSDAQAVWFHLKFAVVYMIHYGVSHCTNPLP
jgi:hypothetical protein